MICNIDTPGILSRLSSEVHSYLIHLWVGPDPHGSPLDVGCHIADLRGAKEATRIELCSSFGKCCSSSTNPALQGKEP